MCEAIRVCAGFDDCPIECEPIDNRSAQPRVCEGLGPAREGLVACDGDGVLLFPFGEDLEEKLGAAPVQFHIAELVDTEQVDAAVTGDGLGENLLVSCFNEFVHEPGGEGVFDPVALLRRGRAETNEQMRLAGPGVADEAQGCSFADPVPGREGVDGCGVDVRVSVEIEISQPLVPAKVRCFDPSDGGCSAAAGTVCRDDLQAGSARVGPRRQEQKRPNGAVRSRSCLHGPTVTRPALG